MVHVTADLRGGEAFSGPKDLMVGPGQTAAYPLTFRAPWIGDYVGNLDLNFPATGVFAHSALDQFWQTMHPSGACIVKPTTSSSVYMHTSMSLSLLAQQCLDSILRWILSLLLPSTGELALPAAMQWTCLHLDYAWS